MAVTPTMVHRMLAEHPNLDDSEIEVSVQGRRVVLQGRVRTQREWEEVGSAVCSIPGVEAVENNLVVTGEPI